MAERIEGLAPVGSVDALLGAEIDAVVVAAPTHEHFDLGCMAVRAGKHVLMEKPFTRTSTQAEKLSALADRHGVQLMPAQVARFLPPVTALRDRLATEDAGPLVQAVERRFTHRTDVAPWWQAVPEFLIPHLGSHSLDVFLWLTGAETAEVRCWASSRQPGYSSIDDFTLVATTTDGAVLSLHQTFASRTNVLDWIMVWERGTATVDELRSCRWNDAPLVDLDMTSSMIQGFATQADEFVGACLGRRPLKTTVASLLPTLRALDDAIRDAGVHVG